MAESQGAPRESTSQLRGKAMKRSSQTQRALCPQFECGVTECVCVGRGGAGKFTAVASVFNEFIHGLGFDAYITHRVSGTFQEASLGGT